jgi:hypothetical protein
MVTNDEFGWGNFLVDGKSLEALEEICSDGLPTTDTAAIAVNHHNIVGHHGRQGISIAGSHCGKPSFA